MWKTVSYSYAQFCNSPLFNVIDVKIPATVHSDDLYNCINSSGFLFQVICTACERHKIKMKVAEYHK